DAAEELAAGRLPRGAAAFQDGNVGVAERLQPLGRLPGESLVAAAVEHDDRHGAPWQEIRRPQLELRERQRYREKRMSLVVHPLLARVEQGELRALLQPLPQLGD